MSETGIEAVQRPPRAGAVVEYQMVRLDGAILVSFHSTLDIALAWLPDPGFEIWGPCAARCRIPPDGPWFVGAYYPEGFPGPRGEWPETGLPRPARMLPAA